MAYTYKYVPIQINGLKSTTPKDEYISLFQQTLNDQFYNSSDWWTIQEETSLGSEVYQDVDVRINHVINAETGLKLGDDFKTLLFKSVDHDISLGKLFKFDSNTWLTTNIEKIKNLTGTCTIRRCNNTLRWIDEATGQYYEEPCSIEYLVKEPRNYATTGSPFITPGGFLHILVQFNARTNLIRENQRFLFGNTGHWTCYKTVGTGINDFQNAETYDNSSAKILTLDLVADFVNFDLDDVINGIADVNTNVYTLSLNKSTAEGVPSDTVQLIGEITYNGRSVTRTIEWSSNNDAIATVDSDGLVTLIAVGTATITAQIQGNPTSATCGITVSLAPQDNYEIRISPDANYVLEGSSRQYSVYLYENDIQLADAFTITCNGNNVPSTSYSFSKTANGFTINNITKSDDSYLDISCTSGLYNRVYRIYLKGAW